MTLPKHSVLGVWMAACLCLPLNTMALEETAIPVKESLGQVTFSNGKVMDIDVGIGSGAYHYPGDPDNVLYALTDRGPNIPCSDSEDLIGVKDFCKKDNGEVDEDGKIFPIPNFAPSIFKLELNTATPGTGSYTLLESIPLKDRDGNDITGLTNDLRTTDTENGYDENGVLRRFDNNGLDPEGIVKLDNGTFWIGEEYGPSLVHVAADGRIMTRLVPAGVDADLADANYDVMGALPAIWKKRKLNRGIESVAVSPNGKYLYTIIQSPLANPDNDAYKASRLARILKLRLNDDGSFSEIVGEYVYVMNRPELFLLDNASTDRAQSDVKLSEMVAIDTDELIVLERISADTKLFRINLAGATNILNSQWDDEATTPSLELTPVKDAGIQPVIKQLAFDARTANANLPSKIEGIALLDDEYVALINDNDFGIGGDTSYISIKKIRQQLSNGGPRPILKLVKLGRYETGVFDESAAEIVAYDYNTKRLFVVNANAVAVDVLDISNPNEPQKVGTLDGSMLGGVANSVAVKNGKVAVAIEDTVKQNPGKVALFNTSDLSLDRTFDVGSLPDMLTFTPDGSKILVANEGEPSDDYSVDPEGSVSIIDLSSGNVTTAGFDGFDKATLIAQGVRIFGNNGQATVAEDLEPEYITVAPDGKKAWVALQENNALAVVDLQKGEISSIIALGEKDYSQQGNELDVSDKDDKISLKTWANLVGMYQPDSIASYIAKDGNTYVVTANEGDGRDYDGFSEEERVAGLTLDPTAFPNAAEIQTEDKLGRLKVTKTLGDTDGDGDYDKLYSYGARSFSIWDEQGNLVFDSGSAIERITINMLGTNFNDTDSRSDDKGAEPEALTLGKIGGHWFAFVGLERTGGILVYDITEPQQARFVTYLNDRVFPENAEDETGDIAPEGMAFISAQDSPNGQNLLVVANEVSGTTTVYAVILTQEALPKLGDQGFKVDMQGQGGLQDTRFYGGLSYGDNAPDQQVSHTLLDEVSIDGSIVPDTQDIGQNVDLLVVAEYTPLDMVDSPFAQSSFYMIDHNGNVLFWDGNMANLAGFSQGTTLSSVENLNIYKGLLPLGRIRVFFGYRNNTTGEITYTLTPIELTVNDDNTEANNGVALRTTIIHINDHHSHLVEEDYDLTFGGTSTRVKIGGFARVASKINELRNSVDNPLVLHAGDAIQGTLYYTLFKGEPDAKVINAVGFDAFELGNHEFDDGNEQLANFLAMLDPTMPVLAANIDFSQSPILSGKVQPYTIKQIGTEEVAIVGLDTLKTLASSAPGKDLVFSDEVETAKAVVADLEAQGYNKIILLTHYGYKQDQDLAAQVPGVDVIIGGDSHTLLGDATEMGNIGLEPEGAYPTKVTTPRGETACIAHAWQYSHVVGELSVEFDANGVVTACSGQPHVLVGDTFLQENAEGERVEVSSVVRAEIMGIINNNSQIDVVTPDANIASLLQDYTDQVEERSKEVIGQASSDLLHIRVPGTHDSGVELSTGSLIAPLVAEGFLDQLNRNNHNAAMVIQNAGGVRIDVPQGDITIETAYTLLPFANTIVVMDMSGAEVKQVLEEALSNIFDEGGSTGSFPYAANIRYTIDMNQASGQRVTSLEIKGTDGSFSPLVDDTLYRIGTNSFTGAGRDGYLTFGDIQAKGNPDLCANNTSELNGQRCYLDTYFDYAESFVNYVKQVGTLNAPESTGVTYIPASN